MCVVYLDILRFIIKLQVTDNAAQTGLNNKKFISSQNRSATELGSISGLVDSAIP